MLVYLSQCITCDIGRQILFAINFPFLPYPCLKTTYYSWKFILTLPCPTIHHQIRAQPSVFLSFFLFSHHLFRHPRGSFEQSDWTRGLAILNLYIFLLFDACSCLYVFSFSTSPACTLFLSIFHIPLYNHDVF